MDVCNEIAHFFTFTLSSCQRVKLGQAFSQTHNFGGNTIERHIAVSTIAY